MKKFFLKQFMALAMAITLVLGLTTPWSRAAGTCVVNFSDPTVTVGNHVTVTVRVTGPVYIGTVKVAYDPNYLQFISGDLGYGYQDGNVIVMDKENPTPGNMSFSMTFKALKAGKTTIQNYENSMADGNGDILTTTPGYSNVTINAPQTASGNNNLSSLSISPGTLSPGFSAGTTNYKDWVSNSTTSVAVSAQAADGKAKVAVWGNTGLDVGDNTVTVQVTAENGSKKTYTITVNRASGSSGGNTGGNTGGGGNTQNPENTPEPSPTPTPEPEIMVTLPDETQLPVSTQLPEGVEIPKGFEESQLEVEGKTLPVAVHKQANLTAVYLVGDEKHPAGFYFYNEKTGEAVAITPVDMASGKLTLIDLPKDVEIPEGYASTLMELGGQQHTLLIPDGVEEPNHYIVCALDEGGNMGLYLYDVEQKSFQRYQFLELPQEEPEETEEPKDTGFVFSLFGLQVTTPWSDQVVSYLLAGLGLLGVVLLVAVIVLAVCLAKSRKALHRAWMREEEQRQMKIISGAHASGLMVDDILAEYTTKADQGPTEEPEQPSETQDDDNE